MNLATDENRDATQSEVVMSLEQQDAVAAALGLNIYRTTWHIPQYRIGESGDWKIAPCPFHIEFGYISRQWAIAELPLLMRRRRETEGWEVWMSLTPHEIESQELACRHATGHSVIMGLGMGWVALNTAFNPAVATVTIVERDPDVISLFKDAGALDQLPDAVRNKINIICADALTWSSEMPVDFLYVDIWRDLDEPQVVDQIRAIQKNVQSNSVYFWGQEIKLGKLLSTLGRGSQPKSIPDLRRLIQEHIQLPLLMPIDLDYLAMIDTVMEIRRDRGYT